MKMHYLPNEHLYEGFVYGKERRVIQVPRPLYDTAMQAYGERVTQAEYWVERAAMYRLVAWDAGISHSGFWTIRKQGQLWQLTLVAPNEEDADYWEAIRERGERFRTYVEAVNAVWRLGKGHAA